MPEVCSYFTCSSNLNEDLEVCPAIKNTGICCSGKTLEFFTGEGKGKIPMEIVLYLAFPAAIAFIYHSVSVLTEGMPSILEACYKLQASIR